MHYIRFLKTPKITSQPGSVILTATITVTTDLGETFYPDDLPLVVTIRAPDHNGDIYMRRTLQWSANARALPISLDITRSDVDWPAIVHIALKGGKSTDHFEGHPTPGNLPSVISIRSEELDPLKGVFETSRRVVRQFQLLSQRTLTIYEDAGDSIARHLWDGSLALTAYIDHVIALQAPQSLSLLERVLLSATFKRLHVLELGCGCGIVGLGLAQTIPDTEVLLTDLSEAEELVVRNIECADRAIASAVEFCALDWEDGARDAPAPRLPRKVAQRTFDLILLAECIYNSDSIPALVGTLRALVARSPKAVILVSTKVRHESEALFWDLFAAAGFVTAATARLPLPGLPGSGYGDGATHVDVYVCHGPALRGVGTGAMGERRASPPTLESAKSV